MSSSVCYISVNPGTGGYACHNCGARVDYRVSGDEKGESRWYTCGDCGSTHMEYHASHSSDRSWELKGDDL